MNQGGCHVVTHWGVGCWDQGRSYSTTSNGRSVPGAAECRWGLGTKKEPRFHCGVDGETLEERQLLPDVWLRLLRQLYRGKA